MHLQLEQRIQLGLLLLMLLPMGGYHALGLLFPTQTGQMLQQAASVYQSQFELGLLHSVLQAQRTSTLPAGIEHYWLKQEQRESRFNCEGSAGQYTIQQPGAQPLLYFCLADDNNKQHLYAFNLIYQLKQLLTADSQRVHLLLVKNGLISGFTKENGHISPFQEHLPPPLLAALNTNRNSLNYGGQEYAWWRGDRGLTLLVSQHMVPDTGIIFRGITLLGITLLLSWLLARGLNNWLRHQVNYLAQASAQVALGNFSIRLPPPVNNQLRLINLAFNRMLDEIQQQKLTLERQNIELQRRNERLDQAVDGLQTLRNEQFETARHTMLAPELTVLRHGLKAPLSKLKTAIDELQKNQTVMESYLGRSAMDRAELRNHSLQCGDLLQQAHTSHHHG